MVVVVGEDGYGGRKKGIGCLGQERLILCHISLLLYSTSLSLSLSLHIMSLFSFFRVFEAA